MSMRHVHQLSCVNRFNKCLYSKTIWFVTLSNTYEYFNKVFFLFHCFLVITVYNNIGPFYFIWKLLVYISAVELTAISIQFRAESIVYNTFIKYPPLTHTSSCRSKM